MTSPGKQEMKKGFTLIEMLVVVALILLLGGALYPALLRAKEWGRSTKCLSNLRQFQVASIHYATDTGHLPRSTDGWYLDFDGWRHTRGWVAWNTWPGFPSDGPRAGSQHSGGTYSWRGAVGLTCITNGALWSYVKREKAVYLCPTFEQRTVCGQTDAVRSYSMNQVLNHRVFADQSMQASRTVLFGDDGALLTGVAAANVDAQFATNEVGRWHGGKGHVIYVDGHTDRW